MATASVVTRNAASVLVVSTNSAIRNRLRKALTAQRWDVHEADGGAAALLLMDEAHPHATLIEGTLRDLHLEDFAAEARASHPAMDLIALDGTLGGQEGFRSARRGELLQVLRSVCDTEEPTGVADAIAPVIPIAGPVSRQTSKVPMTASRVVIAQGNDTTVSVRVPE